MSEAEAEALCSDFMCFFVAAPEQPSSGRGSMEQKREAHFCFTSSDMWGRYGSTVHAAWLSVPSDNWKSLSGGAGGR